MTATSRTWIAIAAILGIAGGFTLTVESSGDHRATAPPDAAAAAAELPVVRPAPDQTRIDEAVSRGLAWLAARQDIESGAWVQDVGFKYNERYEVTKSHTPHVGVSSLALMAFLAGGHLPSRGQYGRVVERGTDFVVDCVNVDTGFISANETRMYSHAFATLYLAEVFGQTRRRDLQAKLQHAVDLTVASQNRQGSWRYRPYAPDSDMSIAVCQLMALRAARNIGIQVPRQTIERAYEYIHNSAYLAGRHRGAFKYQIDQDQTRYSFALTAAGVASLIHAGYYDDPLIPPGIQWLKGRIASPAASERFPHYFYWYGHYYAAQAMFIAADRRDMRGVWSDFYWPHISNELLELQSADGSWRNSPGPGDVFGTAVACVILQIPYEFLPIFQR